MQSVGQLQDWTVSAGHNFDSRQESYPKRGSAAGPDFIPDLKTKVVRGKGAKVDYLFFQIIGLKFSEPAKLDDDTAFSRGDEMRDAGWNDDEAARRVAF